MDIVVKHIPAPVIYSNAQNQKFNGQQMGQVMFSQKSINPFTNHTVNGHDISYSLESLKKYEQT